MPARPLPCSDLASTERAVRRATEMRGRARAYLRVSNRLIDLLDVAESIDIGSRIDFRDTWLDLRPGRDADLVRRAAHASDMPLDVSRVRFDRTAVVERVFGYAPFEPWWIRHPLWYGSTVTMAETGRRATVLHIERGTIVLRVGRRRLRVPLENPFVHLAPPDG